MADNMDVSYKRRISIKHPLTEACPVPAACQNEATTADIER